MFRTKLIIIFALFSLVNAFPIDKLSTKTALIADANADGSSLWYSTFPLFSIFKPIIELFPNFADIGPKIEIGEKYTNIIVKAEHYKAEELNVQVKGRFVTIEGSKKTENDDRDLSTEFLYTASLPINANTSDVFAKFYSDNYLVVSTPNKGLEKEGIYTDRKVPIVQTQELYIKPVKHEVESPVTPESSSEVTTVLHTVADPIITTSLSEVTTESLILTTVKPTTVSIVETTVEPVTETQKLESSTDIFTNPPIDLEAEKESKTEIKDTPTPYIEVATQNTTPFLENEISDLEPISDQN